MGVKIRSFCQTSVPSLQSTRTVKPPETAVVPFHHLGNQHIENSSRELVSQGEKNGTGKKTERNGQRSIRTHSSRAPGGVPGTAYITIDTSRSCPWTSRTGTKVSWSDKSQDHRAPTFLWKQFRHCDAFSGGSQFPQNGGVLNSWRPAKKRPPATSDTPAPDYTDPVAPASLDEFLLRKVASGRGESSEAKSHQEPIPIPGRIGN
jgi:hypothetical protein